MTIDAKTMLVQLTVADFRRIIREEIEARSDAQAVSTDRLTPVGVARMLKCSNAEIYAALKLGSLPAQRLPTKGRGLDRWTIRRGDADEWGNRRSERLKRERLTPPTDQKIQPPRRTA